METQTGKIIKKQNFCDTGIGPHSEFAAVHQRAALVSCEQFSASLKQSALSLVSLFTRLSFVP